jgi:hypothetical protein
MTPRNARPMSDVQADPTQTHLAKEWNQDSPLISCRFDPNGLNDPDAPTVTVTGSFVARPAPSGPIRLR